MCINTKSFLTRLHINCMAPEVTFSSSSWLIELYTYSWSHMYSLLVDYKYLEARDTLLLLPPTFFFFHLLGSQKLDEIMKDIMKLHLIFNC